MSVLLSDVSFSWDASGEKHLDIDLLSISKGERWFIEGASGSGKSTLLSVLSGVSVPQQGTVSMLGKSLSAMGAVQRDRFRADHMGYIFQQFNLIPFLSVVENVTLPLRFSQRRADKVKDAKAEARHLLEGLGMADFMHKKVVDLSVGQQQRVAAARALIGSPEIILADEPTSSLDEKNSEAFIGRLFTQCEESGATLIFVSHDSSLADMFDHRYCLNRGEGAKH